MFCHLKPQSHGTTSIRPDNEQNHMQVEQLVRSVIGLQVVSWYLALLKRPARLPATSISNQQLALEVLHVHVFRCDGWL